MNIGLLWFDNSGRDLGAKIERAAAYYHQKYGGKPNRCFLHPTMLLKGSASVEGIEVRASNNVLVNHFWMGIEAEPIQASPADHSADPGEKVYSQPRVPVIPANNPIANALSYSMAGFKALPAGSVKMPLPETIPAFRSVSLWRRDYEEDLKRQLRELKGTQFDWSATLILYHTNGYQNALGYIDHMRRRARRQDRIRAMYERQQQDAQPRAATLHLPSVAKRLTMNDVIAARLIHIRTASTHTASSIQEVKFDHAEKSLSEASAEPDRREADAEPAAPVPDVAELAATEARPDARVEPDGSAGSNGVDPAQVAGLIKALAKRKTVGGVSVTLLADTQREDAGLVKMVRSGENPFDLQAQRRGMGPQRGRPTNFQKVHGGKRSTAPRGAEKHGKRGRAGKAAA